MPEPVRQPTTWRGFALPLEGGQVLLSRDAAGLLVLLIRRLEREGALSGGVLGQELRRLDQVLRVAIAPPEDMSDVGRADVRMGDVDAELGSPTRADDLVDTKEAAGMLRLSRRQVRRRANDGRLGPVEVVGRSILLQRTEVEAEQHRRQRGAA